jgi:coenzyme Q-binding protein COQ10
MPELSTSRRVHHAASEMFDLVADVERYPEFVPLCQSLRVRKRMQEDGKDIIVADMTIAYKLVRETFTSRVTLDRANLEILVEYLEGPFRRLNNRWRFRPAGERACNVEFYIAYEFRSRTLGMLMGAVFDAAFRRFASAFEQRADKVYGAQPA